jgi:hypothetical protein
MPQQVVGIDPLPSAEGCVSRASTLSNPGQSAVTRRTTDTRALATVHTADTGSRVAAVERRSALAIVSYSVIGDCNMAALVAAEGAVDRLCLPAFDSPPAFS